MKELLFLVISLLAAPLSTVGQPPICSKTIGEAPPLRLIKLGMTVDEVSARLGRRIEPRKREEEFAFRAKGDEIEPIDQTVESDEFSKKRIKRFLGESTSIHFRNTLPADQYGDVVSLYL